MDTDQTQFGDWTVLGSVPGPRGLKFDCRCKCGTRRLVVARDVRAGRSTGCGCERRLKCTAAARAANSTHGMENSPEYKLWVDMRRRCHQPQRPDFHRYGARGIFVCDEWRHPGGGFEAFYRDMGPRPGPGYSIDRVDNDGPYNPGNCVWATKQRQDRNRRNSVFVTIDGEVMNLKDASERYGVEYGLLLRRIRTLGWDAKRAISQPSRFA